MILTNNQKSAIESAIEWYFSDSSEKPLFVIGGYAGTGKTTIVNMIIEILGLAKYNVLFSAYTGKAVNVLRRKRNIANTIHRTFYNIYKDQKGLYRFKIKNNLPSVVKLIVLDELSMINDKMMEDILSFNIPVIGLGDPGQLPPIYGKNSYIEEPDVFLKEVMRQNDDSGILELATLARESKPIENKQYKKSRIISENEIDKYSKYDIILCWKNETRRIINKIVRDERKIDTIFPVKDEKLVCLKNNYFYELEYEDIPIFLVNGLNCISIENSEEKENYLRIKFKPDYIEEDIFFDSNIDKNIFLYGDDENLLVSEDESIAFVDFGYGLTVHKSQGSEWDNVLIIDEYDRNDPMYPKWLYTAITRARHSVTIMRV